MPALMKFLGKTILLREEREETRASSYIDDYEMKSWAPLRSLHRHRIVHERVCSLPALAIFSSNRLRTRTSKLSVL